MEVKLDRKFLSALGIDGDKADQICNINSQTISRIKAENDELKEQLETAKTDIKKVTKERDDYMTAHPEDGGENPYEAKYNKVKKELDEFKSSVAAKELLEKKKAAFKALCKDAELSDKGTEKALKYAEWDKVELDENGEIKGKTDHLKGVKEEWADYVQHVQTQGADVKTPPKGDGGGTPSRAKELAAKYREANYGKAETQ